MARGHYVAVAVIALSIMLSVQLATAATTYTITVTTDKSFYGPNQTIKITGTVSPAPGQSTGAFIKVTNPIGKVVFVWDAPVGAATGNFNASLFSGGTSDWINGTYIVNATWGAYPPQIFHTVKFSYPTAPVTTTTTTTSSSSTSTTTSTTSSKSTSSSSSSSSSSTSSTSSSSSTKSSSTSSSSSSGGGGIPEFPFQAGLIGVFAVVIAAAYLLTRRSSVGVRGLTQAR